MLTCDNRLVLLQISISHPDYRGRRVIKFTIILKQRETKERQRQQGTTKEKIEIKKKVMTKKECSPICI
jgi:hypothetical protein